MMIMMSFYLDSLKHTMKLEEYYQTSTILPNLKIVSILNIVSKLKYISWLILLLLQENYFFTLKVVR